MAATAKKGGISGILWKNSVSDDEEPLAFVPGVDGVVSFSLGPGSNGTTSKNGPRIQARRGSACTTDAALKKGGKKQDHLQSDHCGSYTKGKSSTHLSAAVATEHNLFQASGASLPLSQVISETSRSQSQICLKDLCPEDKRRIANLIEELARVSEEKEESVQRLKEGQENFERKIQHLEQQNVVIAEERESLQQQYRECQELLGLYQQYLSQQQMKLNQSIAQLSEAPAHSKVLSSQEAPSRTTSGANGPIFDGSYLSLATTQARQPQVHQGGGQRGALQTLSNPTSLSFDSEFSPTDEQINQHRTQKRECRESHSKSHQRCEHYQGSYQDSGYGTQQGIRNNGHTLENSHQGAFIQYECKRIQSGNSTGFEPRDTLTSPLLGHEDWEEKRHQLLLQKMQLEMEREKLQARLAEQEETLNRQNQQLCQSRLEYKRFREATQYELSSSNTNNEGSQQEGPSNRNVPASVRKDTAVHPAEQNMHETCLQTAPAPPLETILHTSEGSMKSKRDMATSPAKSPATLSKPTLVPMTHKTPEDRLDFSVVELLDIFSPVAAPQRFKPSTRTPKTSLRRPTPPSTKAASKTLLTSAGHYPQDLQDLEESQILEDIFFIC